MPEDLVEAVPSQENLVSPAQPQTEQRSRLWIALGCAAVVAVGVVLGRALLGVSGQAPETSEKVKFVLHLETFVINLADPDEKAYLRIGVDLGLKHAPSGKDEDKEVPVAAVRDAVLEVLAQGKPAELLTAAGKGKLKADLLGTLRRRMPALGVEEVYFTEFLIQQ
ncbi:MAG TPA: flagellar basal body-associated FliL family protein [Terriglobales bacterium]|jgi:flagellar basal body-associated protein FliL